MLKQLKWKKRFSRSSRLLRLWRTVHFTFETKNTQTRFLYLLKKAAGIKSGILVRPNHWKKLGKSLLGSA